jgi:hypothetical protein
LNCGFYAVEQSATTQFVFVWKELLLLNVCLALQEISQGGWQLHEVEEELAENENTGGELIPSLHPIIPFLLPVAV